MKAGAQNFFLPPGAGYPSYATVLAQNNFENSHVVGLMAIFYCFLNNFHANFVLNFLALILSASPNMMHFIRTFSVMRASGARLTGS